MLIKLQKRFVKADLPLDVRELAEALWLTQFDLGSAVVEPEEERHEVEQDSESPAQKLPTTVAPPIESGQTAQAESARLSAVGAGSEGAPAVEVRLPGVTPLPHSLALGRALRPLARRRASTHRLELDEETTAIRAAESAVNKQLIVSPVFRSAPERWFSVAIVVEEGAAMSVWQPTAEELVRLFTQHGGFNEVALWRLRFQASKQGEKAKPPVLVSPATGQTQPVGSLQRLGQRQLVVLLTDGVSTRWRDGRMAETLARWGRTGTVVIAQVFGERMWQHTALGEPQFVVTAEAPGNPNKALLIEPRLPKDHLAFPVVSLSPELIGEWARMVMLPGSPYSAIALKVRPESSIGGTGSAGENNRSLPSSIQEMGGTGSEPVSPVFSISAEKRLAEFRHLVSDEAYQLAIYLSWLPLALPVMRLVQAAMFAEARPETLAEFLLAGIARRKDGDQPIADPNKQQFVFHDGIREALQTRIRRDELPPILRLIGDYISHRIGRRFSFTALLPHPDGDKSLPLDDELQQFADILREGLIRIGLGHLFETKKIELEPEPETPLTLETFTFDTIRLNPNGEVKERFTLTARQFVEPKAPELNLEMVEIPGGSFLMGTSDKDAVAVRKEYKRYKWDETWIDTEMPQHQVEVPPFYIGKFTITQAQWRIVAGWDKVERDLDPDPAYFKDKPDSARRPVEQISWADAKEFCARLAKKTSRAYRLPTEAEWEYACRAGTTTPFSFGETINTEFVNFDGSRPYGKAKKGKDRNETVPVGSLGVANGFGLFDMHGNVWEWCEDTWHNSYNDAPDDGSARLSGEDSGFRVVRGGAYIDDGACCRSAQRRWYDDFIQVVGFRVVVSARTF